MRKNLSFYLTYAYLVAAHALFFSSFAVVAHELYKGFWRWTDLLVFFVTFNCVGVSVTVFYHRYFTHRAFLFTPVGKWTARPLLAWAAMASWQGPPKIWAAQHEQHHQHADAVRDPHGPVRNVLEFIYVQMALYTPRVGREVDVEGYAERHAPRYDWFEKYACGAAGYFLLGMAIPFAVSSYFAVGPWYFAAVGSVFNLVCLVNSLGHGAELIKRQPKWIRSVMNAVLQQTHKTSYCANTINMRPCVALIGGYLTAGELNHNTHHMYANSAKIGAHWYDCDVGFWLISTLERVGLVNRVRRPPRATALDDSETRPLPLPPSNDQERGQAA